MILVDGVDDTYNHFNALYRGILHVVTSGDGILLGSLTCPDEGSWNQSSRKRLAQVAFHFSSPLKAFRSESSNRLSIERCT